MRTFKSQNDITCINVLSNINEIKQIDLINLTDKVKLPKHYCIVALVFKQSYFEFCAMIRSKKEGEINITPILAKISEEDSEAINANVGDKLIIDRSALERGVHVNIPTMISSINLRSWFNNNIKIVNDIMNSQDEVMKQIRTEYLIMVEFKIVPVVDIKGAIDMSKKVCDPFAIIINNKTNAD